MTLPSSKAEWRRWARTLPPVPDEVARSVARHLEVFLAEHPRPVLGYEALADEVPLHVPVDLLPRVETDGSMVLVDSSDRVVDPASVAVVLVPARVYDREGFRLGRGGGHYDRLVPELAPGTPIVGVTCSARIVDALPREPHDRPMTHLVTEHGVTPVQNSTPEASGADEIQVENDGPHELDP